MSEYCIELNHLTKKFGNFTAIDDLSLKLKPGKIYGIIGPNGAGKSTTMGMIMGSLFPTTGDGNVYGFPLSSTSALKLLGYSPEFTSFYTDMNCIEYLHYMGCLGGLSSKESLDRTYELLKKFNLLDHANRKVAKFSTGMKKKVSLAQAMIHHPKVLLLDEPTANLDPTSRQEILDTVRSMVEEENLTVLISSHVLTELETVIHHVLMIDHGKLILDESIHDAQERFKQGILVLDTDNNESLYEQLKDHWSCELKSDCIKITTAEMDTLKREIQEKAYHGGILIRKLNEEVISLDTLYKQIMEGENNNESNI